MKRLFKPGDRVRQKSGGPIMEIIKYVEESNVLLGKNVSSNKVLCVWYEPVYGRKTSVFHQRGLSKANAPIRTLATSTARLHHG